MTLKQARVVQKKVSRHPTGDDFRFYDLSEKLELCRFDCGKWSVRQKLGDDRAHIAYLSGLSEMVANAMFAGIERVLKESEDE